MSGAPGDTDWQERALRAEAALEEARRDRARLWEELLELRARDREEEHFYKLYRALEDSVSWKLTKPLRAGKTYAGKARRALEQRSD